MKLGEKYLEQLPFAIATGIIIIIGYYIFKEYSLRFYISWLTWCVLTDLGVILDRTRKK